MRLWLPVVLAAALLVAGGASALAVPSIGGPTGIVMLPTAEIASIHDWQTAVNYRTFQSDFMYEDVSLWSLNVLRGVAGDAELWIAFQRATGEYDSDIWRFGGKYLLSEQLFPRGGFLGGTDLALGGSYGRWTDGFVNASTMYDAAGATDLDTLQFYLVATKHLIGGDTREWETPVGTRVIGSLGLLYLSIDPDLAGSDTLVRPFLGVEIIGEKNLKLAFEYRFKDSDIEDDALFSTLLSYPLGSSTTIEAGLTNASPIGLAVGDQNMFWRLTYAFPVSYY